MELTMCLKIALAEWWCFWLLLNLAVIYKSDSFDLTILFASYTV